MLKYEVHEADPSKGYNFPFILIYPKKMQKDVKIFVEGNNSVNYVKTDKDGNIVGYQTFEEQQQDAVAFAKTICKKEDGKTFNVAYMYQQLNQPLVIPIIERCDAEHDDEYYPQMLSRNVMLDKSSKYANLPEQVVNMVKEAKKICLSKNPKVQIAEKSGLCGFSTSGVFAGRMLFAEPEHFDVCLSMCSNAVQPLPTKELFGVDLPYPLGTADYEKMFGKPFNIGEYHKAKQMFFVGVEEDNKKYDIAKNPRLHDRRTRSRFKKLYGDLTIQERQIEIAKIMQELGMDNTASLVVPGGHNFGGKSKYILDFEKIVLSNGKMEKLLDISLNNIESSL